MALKKLKAGLTVRVKCETQPGPLDEELVTIDSRPVALSGFVKKTFVEKKGASCYLLAK